MAPLTRRDMLAGLMGAPLAAPAAAQRPNVLFLAVDDLNDWVEGFGGHPQTVTPNIERLARRGVRFERAYCQAPMCNPSRASLMTGLRPSTTGVYENDDTWRDGAPDAVTLPEYFMQHGYRAIGTGKIFHGKQTQVSCFHEYYTGDTPEGDSKSEKPPGGPKVPKVKIDWGGNLLDDEETEDYRIGKYAIDVLGRKHAQPFFLACGFHKPHLPWYVPKKYFDRFPPDKVKLPEYFDGDLKDVPASAIRKQAVEAHRRIVEAGKWREAVAAYLACINYTDANVGRVLDALDRSPYRDNTFVFLWGDHGWHLGEKQHWQKFTLWERSCRAPFLVAGPGVKQGVACRRVVEFLDMYPTLAGLCGLPAKEKIEGTSIAPLLRDPSRPWDRPAITSNGPEKITVRTERWRYTRYRDGEELFDHGQDPSEWTNLASKPGMEQVKRELAGLLPARIAPPGCRSWDKLPPEEKARLRGKPRG